MHYLHANAFLLLFRMLRFRLRVIYFLALSVVLVAFSQGIRIAPFLPRFVTQSSSSVDPPLTIVITEEHHHVVRYWFSLGEDVPRTVLHVDAHSDLGLPMLLPEAFQKANWPSNQKDARVFVRSLAVGNDDFMVGSILAGTVRRLLWVWPSWLPPSWWPSTGSEIANCTARKVYQYGVTKPLELSPCVCMETWGERLPRECLAVNSVGEESTVAPAMCNADRGPRAEVLALALSSMTSLVSLQLLLFGNRTCVVEAEIQETEKN